MKELNFERMEEVQGGGCNDRSDALGTSVLCLGFTILSCFPATMFFGVVGSLACSALAIGCAYRMA